MLYHSAISGDLPARLGKCSSHSTTGYEAMKHFEGFLIAALVAGVWTLIALHAYSISQAYAQQTPVVEQAQDDTSDDAEIRAVHASEIVGLSALIEKSIRDHRLRPQAMPGLEQYIKSVVRRCKITGSVRGDRISSANITC